MTYRAVNGSSAKISPRTGRSGKFYYKFNMSGLATLEEVVPGGGGGGGVSIPGMNKGDLISAIALDTTALLKVGFDGQFLMVDSVAPVGLKWTTLTLPESGILPSIVDARGDLIAGDAPDYVVRVPLGTNGHVLSADSTVLGGIKWIAPPSGVPADGSITDAMLRDSAATSVIGRSVATAGDPADISAITDGHVLRRAAGILAFGPLDLSDTDSITGTLPAGNLPATATSVDIPKSIVTTKGDLIAGDGSALPVRVGLGTNGYVLSADSTVTGGIKWIAPPSGTPPADSITNAMLRDSIAFSVMGKPDTGTGNPSDIGSAADNNVLRRSGAAIGWGAINLAGGAAAVTGILPAGNVAQPLAASNIPTIDISTAQVTGTLPVNKGGTGLATLTSGSLLVGAGTSPVTFKSLPLSASDVAAPAAGSITRTMLANGIANSVMGVAGNAGAAVADIGSAADGNALRRSGNTLGFGPINLAGGASAITGTLPTGNMAVIDISTGSATGILPVSKGGTGHTRPQPRTYLLQAPSNLPPAWDITNPTNPQGTPHEFVKRIVLPSGILAVPGCLIDCKFGGSYISGAQTGYTVAVMAVIQPALIYIGYGVVPVYPSGGDGASGTWGYSWALTGSAYMGAVVSGTTHKMIPGPGSCGLHPNPMITGYPDDGPRFDVDAGGVQTIIISAWGLTAAMTPAFRITLGSWAVSITYADPANVLP